MQDAARYLHRARITLSSSAPGRVAAAVAAVALSACGSPASTAAGKKPPDPALEQPGSPDAIDDAQAILRGMAPSVALSPIPEALAESRLELRTAVDRFLHIADEPRRFVTTDKPLYQPGETVWFRLWELGGRADNMTARDQPVSIELLDPKGAAVVHKSVQAHGGVAAGDVYLAADAHGGRYTLKLQSQLATVEKAIIVSSYRTPLIKKQLEFVRASYRAGDQVELAIALSRATGEPLARQRATAIVALNGGERERIAVTTDGHGRAMARFALPADVGAGNGLVTLLIDAGGVTESAQKAIPIQLSGLELQLFPEGGDLIVGLPGRVYFTARRMDGRPARVAGRVLDDRGREVAALASSHRGMGRFAFTPQAGRRYRVEVPGPSGSVTSVPLPVDLTEGCSLQAVDDVAPRARNLRVGVWCTDERTIIAHAAQGDRHLGDAVVRVAALAPHLIEIPVPDSRRAECGIVRITVFDERLTPLAERVVYRDMGTAAGKPGGLQVTLTSDRTSYAPGDDVELTVTTRDSSGQPIAADLSLAVVDDAVLAMSDDDSPNLPAAFHLVSALTAGPGMSGDITAAELIEHIGDPDFYFSDDPLATSALDLVLGTYGWRRFVWKHVFDPDQDHDRILDMNDMCPLEPETYNGVDDEDGCPDRARVVVMANKIEIRDPNYRPPPPPPKPTPVVGDPAGDMRTRAGASKDKPPSGWRRQERGLYAPVREFPRITHKTARKPGAQRSRDDFRETVFWQASVRTDQHGQARVRFSLSDAVTSFRASAQGISVPINTEQDQQIPGQIGHGEALIAARLPLAVALTLPKETTVGDRLEVPITLANDSPADLVARIEADFGPGFAIESALPGRVSLAAGARQTVYAQLRARATADRQSPIRVTATADGLTDELRERVDIAPAGYPFQQSAAGTLTIAPGGKEARAVHSIALASALPGTVEATVTVYPSPVATMMRGADALIREPHGCFEQASSSNYPNIMVLQYLREHGIADPALTAKTRAVLDRGYRKLVGYESPKRGYEWFGGDPGHEALTAYGLLEFTDMAEVHSDVEPAMLARTEKWLLARRDGKGGFARNERALDSFGQASAAVTDAYITYALSQSIRARTGADAEARQRAARALRAELARQRATATETSDPYILALAARTLATLEPEGATAASAQARLAGMQADDGSFPGADHSVTRSGGNNLLIETTALALMALMDAGTRHENAVRKGIGWLRDARSGSGAFGTTQATVLALQALTMYSAHTRSQAADGSLLVHINGARVRTVPLPADNREPVVIDGLAQYLAVGDNQLTLDYRGQGSVPFAVAVDYRGKAPADDASSPVHVTTVLSATRVVMGEPTTLRATVENRSGGGLPMVLARIGIPGGLRFQPTQLEALRKRGLVDFVETRPREIMLYWRSMKPDARHIIDLELLSTLPGQFTGPASQAYLYYDDERRFWAAPATVEIARTR